MCTIPQLPCIFANDANRNLSATHEKEHIPSYAMKVVEEYEGKNREVSKRLQL